MVFPGKFSWNKFVDAYIFKTRATLFGFPLRPDRGTTNQFQFQIYFLYGKVVGDL